MRKFVSCFTIGIYMLSCFWLVYTTVNTIKEAICLRRRERYDEE